jgi:hypothetical protein
MSLSFKAVAPPRVIVRRMPFTSLVLAGLLAAPLTATLQPAAARATIADIAWIAGNWTGAAGALTFEERWTPPAAGAMLAVARTIKGERMVAFEFLRIIERDGTLVYIAQPDGRPPTEFTLTALEASSATFENPAHDYPTMIRYTKTGDGTLEARISAAKGARPQTFVFQRN